MVKTLLTLYGLPALTNPFEDQATKNLAQYMLQNENDAVTYIPDVQQSLCDALD